MLNNENEKELLNNTSLSTVRFYKLCCRIYKKNDHVT